VCVGASDSTTASNDPNFLRSLCCVRQALPRGARYGPPSYAQHSALGGSLELTGFRTAPRNLFLGGFAIFSGFLN
jgi:hypothetical protein